MSRKTRLNKALVTISLSFISLAANFNTAAQVTGAPLVPPAPQTAQTAPGTAKNDAQTRLNIRLFGAFSSINKHVDTMWRRDPGYDIQDDPVVRRKMDRIRSLLDSGADPDSFVAPGITLDTASDLTAFQAAVVLSAIMNAPELLQFFIDKGANVHKLAPDQWSPIDIAIAKVINTQDKSPTEFKNAFVILDTLIRAGARLEDARKMSERIEQPIRSYTDLAQNPVAAEIMAQQGWITPDQLDAWNASHREKTGQDSLDHKIRNTTSLTAAWIKANGGVLLDFPDALPGGPEPYITQPGDTLHSVAERFKGVMGMGDTYDAVQAIARTSGINAQTTIVGNTRLLIPMPAGRQLEEIAISNKRRLPPPLNHIRTMNHTSVMDVARAVQEHYYDKEASLTKIALQIARINNLDPHKISQQGFLNEKQVLIVPYAADMTLQFAPLTPPRHYRGGREVDLVVIETGGENKNDIEHNKDTYRIAGNIAHGINPDADLSQIHSWAETLLGYPKEKNTDALRMLLNSAGSPINDRVVFSHSMAVFFPSEISMPLRQARDEDGTMLHALMNRQADQLERSRPIIFTASGNWNPEEMRHVQSHAISHSPRSISIGAAGQYGSLGFMMSPYSSHSADVCAPLPKHLGKQMEGTSFATPLSAALFRQFNEWYGDILNFEEIMAAGLMSADRNVQEHLPPQPNGTASARPAQFNSNGGGIPNHERCGAGVLDPEKWQAALDRMVTIKQSLTRTAQESSYDITVGNPMVIPGREAGDKTRYIYRMTIPADMTLGKLTFRLPQYKNRHSEIVIHTPAGFEKHLGYSHTDILSSFAFAYEDVKAGQVIEIRTTEPLGPKAGMVLRGATPGNPIALLRDQLRADGALPAPLQEMSGNTVIGPSAPVTPVALKDFVPAIEPFMNIPGLQMPPEPQQHRDKGPQL